MKLIWIFLLNFFLLCATTSAAQCLPDTEEVFFQRFSVIAEMPERILSGRSLLFYDNVLSQKELVRVQESFAAIGIDAVLALEIDKLLGGHDVKKALFEAIQKREISNLVFIQKNDQGYRCTITTFNKKISFVNATQAAWQLDNRTLGELLLQVKRDLQNTRVKQNFLINDQPETEVRINLIQGSRIESLSSDLRVDKVAVRLSDRNTENEALKEIMQRYPFKVEYVSDSISDAELRLKGFWYVMQSIHLPEKQAKEMLGYASNKGLNSSLSEASVYKFYFKKLEFNNVYLGKEWDAAPTWQEALQNILMNLRKELNIR
jgi:hypothetical protein